jgi:hypothetical protein
VAGQLEEAAAIDAPQDRAAGHGAPEPAVVGLAAVVAHDEDVARGDGDLAGERAAGAAIAGALAEAGIRLGELDAVAHDVTPDERQPIAGQRDHALDERHAGRAAVGPAARLVGPAIARGAGVVDAAERRVEDDDVAELGEGPAVVGVLVGDEVRADAQRRHHRPGGDAVGLAAERAGQREHRQERDRRQRAEAQDRQRQAPAAPGRWAA